MSDMTNGAAAEWTQKSARHYTLRRGSSTVELQYEDAGFASGWAVYVGDRLVERCPEFMQARGVALSLSHSVA